MILLIDSYDSFSYNLVQAIGSIDADIRVVRNDELTLDEIRALHPDRIVLSPGPGRPEDAGVIVDVARELNGVVPMLGVCLGHQAICQAYGATITYARRLMHGKQSPTELDSRCPLFAGCAPNVPVARYHSLAVDPSTLPSELKVTATADDGEVMAVADVRPGRAPVYGVQFHPESIMTPDGMTMLRNFLG